MRKYHVLFLLLISLNATAKISLPKIFSDHMVIQRNKPVHIWGWGTSGEKVTVKLGYATQKTRVNRQGKWELYLPAMPAGGPYTLVVTGTNTLTFEDVLSGEVWICSGQSNMEWPLRLAMNAQKEISQANYPQIRHFKVPLRTSFSEKDDLEGGEWQVCSPATAGDFTAVGYFFALELYREMNIPVGLMNSSWGGTNVETWISQDAFFGDETFQSLRSRMPLKGDTIALQNKQRTDAFIKNLQGALPTKAEEAVFSSREMNDAGWKTMQLPAQWENAGLPDIDGNVWFRRGVDLPAAPSLLTQASISLGPVDDNDSTFVNGQFIGTTNGWETPRKYLLNDGILKPGLNTIAVKVMDNAGGGGIYGADTQLYLSAGKMNYPLGGQWKYRLAKVNTNGTTGPNDYPTLLYNAMINPIIAFPVAGVIWYQGESNAGRAMEYKKSFPLMIKNWRTKWKEDLPFYFVQLANFNAAGGSNEKGGSTWAELREAQTEALQLPHTGMAVTVDIGNSTNIHPTNKQDVGKRLAANALSETYGKSRIHQGPMFDSMHIDGKNVVLTFKNVNNGWLVKNKYGYINGFEISGEDQQFRYAKAFVAGNTIVVMNDQVKSPVAVRYAWADDPMDVNLYNTEGFPAVPFRTDTWKAKTAGVKYNFK